MAAVLALILLPLLIGIGSLVSVVGFHAPLDETLILLFVTALAGGAFYGLMHFIHTLEGPEPDAR